MKRFAISFFLTVSAGSALADSFASIEPVASTSVLDMQPLLDADLDVRTAFADRLFQCGLVDDVERILEDERVTTTLGRHDARVAVSAGGFAGNTNPTYAYSFKDGASLDDVKVLADSLGYVTSQDSVFLLDADSDASLDFPASYAVLEFRRTPSIDESAALFETVGKIDPDLFETDTSGYTQFGRSYLTLQSDVPADEFIDGYLQAAQEFGVTYTPVVGGAPSLFVGSAAFPGNDWVANPQGDEYLARIPHRVHSELHRLRRAHLRLTREVLAHLQHGHENRRELLHFVRHLDCH